jgi:hypothetical protein
MPSKHEDPGDLEDYDFLDDCIGKCKTPKKCKDNGCQIELNQTISKGPHE